MIHKIIEWSLKNRGIVIVFYLGVAVAGYWALTRTPIDAIPDLSDNQVIVFTDWTGRSPQEVEDQVTYPLVTNLQGLPGVRTVRANSAFSFSMINIIFEDNVDLYWARTRVLERLNLVTKQLPEGVTPTLGPELFGDRPRLEPIRFAPAALRRWLRRYDTTNAAEAAMIGVWVDATADDPSLSVESGAALDWARARMARFLAPRGFGDVDAEALVMVALLDAFGARRRDASMIDAAVHIIQRGLLGHP